MANLQTIENALSSINPDKFQELSDCFLALRNENYRAFIRHGSQLGKQNAIKGTPDTFLLLPSGKYMFVEYSTNVSEGVKKLKQDITKCIDVTKTKIPINQIDEIIICVNYKIKPNEVHELRNELINTRIKLTVFDLGSIAIELQLHHRNLVHDYLDLPFDTGQIVSVDTFIEEYKNYSNGIATPLDNLFLHREQELEDMKNALSTNNLVVLTGSSGVGKTKLALESITQFVKENLSYEAFCISNKHCSLLDDLYQYLDLKKDYILFVDDANRIDTISQIIGFFNNRREGKLKLIFTVREYAYNEIVTICFGMKMKVITLTRLSDDSIKDIISTKPFEILNKEFQEPILSIADGNPRIAIMAAQLAKQTQSINSLFNVSDLFENYFSTFIKDKGELATPLNIKCLGLISFFYILPYKNKELITPILKRFEIGYGEFINAIDILDNLELVETQMEYVKIPEQNLSTFFFYKAFIKDELIDFEILLNYYFEENKSRFKDTVIPAYNMMGAFNVIGKLTSKLKSHFQTIKENDEKIYNFLNIFWYLLINESFEFAYNRISQLPKLEYPTYSIERKENNFSYSKNPMLELLSEFFRFPNNVKDSLELCFEYIRKEPQYLSELIHKIKEDLIFEYDDYRSDYSRQKTLFEILINGVSQKEQLLTICFYELSKTFLSYKFQKITGGRNSTINIQNITLPNSQTIQDFRKTIWIAVNDHFANYPELSFELLKSYAGVHPDVDSGIMQYDAPFLFDIITRHLFPSSFEHCVYVQEQIRWCKRNNVIMPIFESLSTKFRNLTYDTYLKIDWDRIRDKEDFEFENYEEYEKLKGEEIRTSFVFNTKEEIIKFLEVFTFLKNNTKNDWNYSKTLDLIIDENCQRNFALGLEIAKQIIKENNQVNYIPWAFFKNHLFTKDKAEQIWLVVNEVDYYNKAIWLLSFFEYLDESLVSKIYSQAILKVIKDLEINSYLHLGRLDKYLKVEPKLYELILKIVIGRNEQEEKKLFLWDDIFENHLESLGEDIQLIKRAYLQQDRMQQHFDFDGNAFMQILTKDKLFLLEYVKTLFPNIGNRSSHENKMLRNIWVINDIENTLAEVFDYVINVEPFFGILEHYCNIFFLNIKPEYKLKAKAFLFNYCASNFNDTKKMNALVDIVRHSMRECFNEFLLHFITLTQDIAIFSKISWIGNGGVYNGRVIIGDLKAMEWKELLTVVEQSKLGIKLIPIKTYINNQIEGYLKDGDRERKQRFFERN